MSSTADFHVFHYTTHDLLAPRYSSTNFINNVWRGLKHDAHTIHAESACTIGYMLPLTVGAGVLHMQAGSRLMFNLFPRPKLKPIFRVIP